MSLPENLRTTLRRLRLGPLALRYFHDPKNYVTWLVRHNRGRVYQSFRGEAAMRRAALQLPTVGRAPNGRDLEVSYMTGRAFWHQTAFCAHSLARQMDGALKPTFFDDGSLEAYQAAALQRIFPHSRIVTVLESREALGRKLPEERFPLIHETCRRVPMMRKLVYLRVQEPGWQLYLDSDMLFFARPELLESCSSQRQPCYMRDPLPGYSIDPAWMARLAGVTPLPDVNAGIVGLDNSTIDWTEIERWLHEVGPRHRAHRLLEQTITGMILSTQRCVGLPMDEYTIVANPAVQFPSAVVLHYIQHAKWPYLAGEWRRYLDLLNAGPNSAHPASPSLS